MNMRRSDLQMIPPFGLLLLQFSMQVWGQSCVVANACSLRDLPRHTIIGLPDETLTQQFSLTCNGNFFYNRLERINWLSSTDGSTPKLLNVVEDPKLRATGSDLQFTNVSGAYEALYYCQAEYTNGDISRPEAVGCLHVAGHAFYTTCPMTPMGGENCATATELQAEVGESVEFDTRIEFRHGGSCGLRQNVRLMFLDKVMENGDTETLFICSNLGGFGNIDTCKNNSKVSVSFQGTSKYDIKLRLDGLTGADSGRYRARVDLDNFVGGRRISIYKNFSVLVPDEPATPVIPEAEDMECSKGFGPVLMLDGEVLSTNSTITFPEIMEGKLALLCVTPNEDCCNGSGDSSAQFISPSNTPVSETPSSGLYVTKGNQIARLNRRESATELEVGQYCCSVSGKDSDEEISCIHITMNDTS